MCREKGPQQGTYTVFVMGYWVNIASNKGTTKGTTESTPKGTTESTPKGTTEGTAEDTWQWKKNQTIWSPGDTDNSII